MSDGWGEEGENPFRFQYRERRPQREFDLHSDVFIINARVCACFVHQGQSSRERTCTWCVRRLSRERELR